MYSGKYNYAFKKIMRTMIRSTLSDIDINMYVYTRTGYACMTLCIMYMHRLDVYSQKQNMYNCI